MNTKRKVIVNTDSQTMQVLKLSLMNSQPFYADTAKLLVMSSICSVPVSTKRMGRLLLSSEFVTFEVLFADFITKARFGSYKFPPACLWAIVGAPETK